MTTKPPSTLPTSQSVPPRTSTPVPNIPAQPHRHASSAPSTISPNTTPYIIHRHQYVHLLPPTTHHPHPPTLLTSEHQSSTQTARTGLTTYGTLASPLHPTTHRPPPTRLPKHMAPTPQTPQPFQLPPPTSPYHSSHHRRIYTFHRFYTLLVVTLPPRHACLGSLHRRRSFP